MADSKLSQIFTTDPSKLLEGYDKILRKTENVLESTRQLARESRAASSGAAKGLEDQAAKSQNAIAGVARMALAYGSVREAVQLVNDEISRQIELQSKAGQAQRTLGNPRASLLQNLGDIAPAELREVKRKIDAMAVAGLGERRILTSAFGELASATPTYTNPERAATLEAAARFAPQPDQLPAIAAGLGDVSGLTGSKDPFENLGVLAATAARSRGTQVSMVAEHIVPAAKNLLSYGNTVPQALALPVAIQNSIVDVEGRVSGTAALGLAEQLQQFFTPANVRERISKEVQREGNLGEFDRPNEAVRTRLSEFLGAEGVKSRSFEEGFERFKRSPELQEKFFGAEVQRRTAGAGTTDEQIALLQRDKAQAEEFIQGFTGERKPLEQIRKLLRDSTSDIAKQYEAFKTEGIPAGDAAAQLGRQQIKNVQSDPAISAQRMALAAENASDKIMTDNFRRGTAGAVRDGLRMALESANTQTVERKALVDGVFGSDAFNAMLAKGLHPLDAAQRILNKRAEELVDPTKREVPFLGAEAGYEPIQRDPELVRSAGNLKALADSLADIKADLDAGVAAEGGAPLDRRRPSPLLDESELPPAAAIEPQIDFDAAGLRRSGVGGLEQYKLADEFDMLAGGRPAAEFTGEHGDLQGLDSFVSGQIQHVKETGGDPAALAVLEQIRDKIDATEKQLAALNKKTADAAAENRAANRSAGARATVGAGRE